MVFTDGDDVMGALSVGDGWRVVSLGKIPEAYRILESGDSIGVIGNNVAGTLGWFAKIGGERYAITNAHVVLDSEELERRADVGDVRVVSPSPRDSQSYEEIGRVWDYVPIVFGDAEIRPSRWESVRRLCRRFMGAVARSERGFNRLDVALIRLHDDVAYTPIVRVEKNYTVRPRGIVGLLFAGTGDYYVGLKMSNVAKAFPGNYFVDLVDPEPGMVVKKMGRTTGFSKGEVVATDVVMKVSYGGRMAVFEDVFVVKAKNAPGDSGSLVFV